MSKGTQIAIAALSVFAAVTWFLGSQAGGEGTFLYYQTVGDYVDRAAPSDPDGEARGVRVHGYVVEGSIVKDLPAGYVDFQIRDDERHVLGVRYSGIDVPDLFGDGAEVVVEGRDGPRSFAAEKIMAKCPSKYEAEAPAGDEV